MTAETATIVVTDLVGSTELRVSLGEERAEEVRRQHDAALIDVARRGGGTVVKGLGDGVLVRFPGAAEAVAAAVAMQQGVDALGRREKAELRIRVGVSSGDVTLEDGDCFGLPVIEASRLCDAAEPDQILIAEVVSLLARGRGGHETRAVGELELKGLAEPLSAHAVDWEPVRAVADLRAQSPYVGRADERRIITDRYTAAADGRGGLVLVVGEPGIGKTRLVTECCDEAAERGALILSGTCHDGEVAAYAPVVEAITVWIRATPGGEVSDMLGADASIIGRVVPAVATVMPDLVAPVQLSADEDARRLHDAMAQVLQRLAERQPVVLVLDDLHWADGATVGLLRAMARTAVNNSLLVIGTYRDTDVDRRHPLGEALPIIRREVEPTRIALEGLDPNAVKELLELIGEQEVPDEFSRMLAEQSEGNPFFLREMLLHLVDEGALRHEDGTWTADPEIATVIPEGVREVVGRRLSHLSVTVNSLLSVGALFKVAFPLPVVAAVAEIDENDALDAVDQALAAQVIQPTGTFDHYAFTHALFRQTLNEELNPSRQVRTHRAIAEALDKQVVGVPDVDQATMLAHHWYQSSALPGAERGVGAAMIVAADAADRYAATEAFEAYSMAVELVPEGDERQTEIERARLEAAIRCLRPHDELAADLEQYAQHVADEAGHDAAADALAELIKVGEWADATMPVRWALAREGARWLDTERRDATWAIIRYGELDEQIYTDPESPGILTDSPERQELLRVFESLDPHDLEPIMWTPSTRESCLHMIERMDAGIGSFFAVWMVGDLDLMLRLGEEWEEEMVRQRNPSTLSTVLSIRARVEAIRGDHAAADATLDRALALADRATPFAQFQLAAAPALVGYTRGAIGQVDASGEILEMADQPDTRWAMLASLAGFGANLAQAGRRDEAFAALDKCMVGIELAPGHAPNYPLLVQFAAQIVFLLDGSQYVTDLERNVRSKVIDTDLRYPEADGRLVMGMLCAIDRRLDEAREWFDAAWDEMDQQRAVALQALVDRTAAQAELLSAGRGGDEQRARDLITRGRTESELPYMVGTHVRLDAIEAGIDTADWG